MRYVMAVDPSLTCSGWAIFDISSNSLQAVGKIKSLSASGHSLPERYEDLQRQVSQLFLHFNLGNSDVVICESETTMIDPKAAFKVERVRGIFETLGRERGCIVPGRISPRTVQFEVGGFVESNYSVLLLSRALFRQYSRFMLILFEPLVFQ